MRARALIVANFAPAFIFPLIASLPFPHNFVKEASTRAWFFILIVIKGINSSNSHCHHHNLTSHSVDRVATVISRNVLDEAPARLWLFVLIVIKDCVDIL
ncbi:hypothetical protein L1987_22355 [Smallanthus sonchifolius]|uniref:Uncharacterized protein n=1 Tax=Smallanthus sonchifolius TaxID=185202 RepID=A0ACB9IGD4_9ASTR|nr:hypothetical protein L1987_22355 [Smallanthus sonchifolius]